jgi:hypothetical protein
MNNVKRISIALAVTGILATWGAAADVPRPVDPLAKTTVPPKHSTRSEQPKAPRHAPPAVPHDEASVDQSAGAGFGGANPFSASQASGMSPNTAIAPPVTITYGGTSTALSVSDSGTGTGVSSSLTKASNTNSALNGTTSGSGAGVRGTNTGTTGPGARFQLTSASSAQSAVFASTPGTGSAITGTITNPASDTAAVYGYNLLTSGIGVGVQGEGNYQGVYGYSPDHFGVYGYSPSGVGILGSSSTYRGIEAYSTNDVGLYASSDLSYAVFGDSSSGSGIYANTVAGSEGLFANNESSGHGITAYSQNGIGIYSSSGTSYGIWGQSANTFAVIGEDSGSGIGVYGYSATGYAGYFSGKVGATSYVTVSDRNAKTNFKPIDGKDVLKRISGLPVTSWEFKADPQKHHVGPTAQDFHAAFGLDGDDDKHINLTDLAGVSLAAIQELNKEMKQKDAQIAELKAQLAAQTIAMADLKSMAVSIAARMKVMEGQLNVHAVSARAVAGAPHGRSLSPEEQATYE